MEAVILSVVSGKAVTLTTLAKPQTSLIQPLAAQYFY